MTSDRRFEQELPALFDQLAYGPSPDYRDHIVRQTARTRQRPAWMFPERWLTVTPITSRVAVAPRLPWRIIAMAAFLIVGLTVAGLIVAGSRPKVPAPFGPAANGAVAYAADGDIYTADHATGVSTALVTGSEWDAHPVWSGDGTRLVFERKAGRDAFSTDGRLVVVNADGSHPVVVTPDPSLLIADVAFSPDGRDVMFTSGPERERTLWLAAADGSGARTVPAATGLTGAAFIAPTGAEIAYPSAPVAAGTGISAVNTATGQARLIVAPTAGVVIDWVRPSPDGSRIAYSASTGDSPRNTYQVHVVRADGATDLILPMPPGATFQDGPEWSNDGTRLAVTRGYADRNEEMSLAVVPADGSGYGHETAHGVISCCDTTLEWSPDDTTILVLTNRPNQNSLTQVLWDPATGTMTPSAWVANSEPTWQRKLR